jgi:C1A family cysteine protease
MIKVLITLISICLFIPTQSYAYMELEKAATNVQKIVEGKMSPWAIRDSKIKVKPRPILGKKATKEMFEQRTRVNSIEVLTKSIKSVDLRPYDSTVKNQEDRGWCTSFATIATIENIAAQQGYKFDLSEIYLWNQYKEYDMYAAAEAAEKTFIINETDWPYRSENPVHNYKEKGVAKLKASTEMTAVNDAIAALDKKQPIVFATETTPYWGSPNRGVIVNKGVTEGGHAIAVVGYYSNPTMNTIGGGFLIFKNSWGTEWGDGGYGYLPFSYCKKYNCYFIRTEGIDLAK